MMTRLLLSTAAVSALSSILAISPATAQAERSCGDNNCSVGGEGLGGNIYGQHFELGDLFTSGGQGVGGSGFNIIVYDETGFALHCHGGGKLEDPKGFNCDFE